MMCKFCEKQESIASCDKDVDAIIDDEGYFNVLQMPEASKEKGFPMVDKIAVFKFPFCPFCRRMLVSAADRKTYEDAFKQWKDEVSILSTGHYEHPAFKRIVDMGQAAVPFILETISKSPDPVVYALFKILPGVMENTGHVTLTDTCKAWITVGKVMFNIDFTKGPTA